mgnify:CR=1 FL=1
MTESDTAHKIASQPSSEQLTTLISNHVHDAPLVKGRNILCPHCEAEQDILAYTALNFVEKYSESLVPVLKCKICRHAFALRP